MEKSETIGKLTLALSKVQSQLRPANTPQSEERAKVIMQYPLVSYTKLFKQKIFATILYTIIFQVYSMIN